eukprot:Gb_06529 [translate_table: standard]
MAIWERYMNRNPATHRQVLLKSTHFYGYCFEDSPNAFHKLGSSKSLIKKAAPASRRACPGFLVVNPTTANPAATPAFNPEGESSRANALFDGTLKCSKAFKYGSGNGFARSHSLPTTKSSKKSVRPTIEIISSAFSLGALVTAARLKPRFSIHLHSLCKPFTGFSCWTANLRKKASLSCRNLLRWLSSQSGKSEAPISSLCLPVMFLIKNSSVMGTPS